MLCIEFLVASLFVVLAPGTGIIYTVSTGLFSGRRASVAAAFGCTAGIVPNLLASIFALSAVVHTSAVVFQGIRYAGGVYLFYLAWSMWREGRTLELESPSGGSGRTILHGFLINILNPKLSIFFLAYLPLFVTQGGPCPVSELFLLGFVFMGMTMIVFVFYGLAADRVSRRVLSSPGLVVRLRRSFACVFAVLGIKLAAADR